MSKTEDRDTLQFFSQGAGIMKLPFGKLRQKDRAYRQTILSPDFTKWKDLQKHSTPFLFETISIYLRC